MIHPQLKAHLERVVDRKRRLQLAARLAGCWVGAGLLGLGLLVIQRQTGWTSSLSTPVVAVLGFLAAITVVLRHRSTGRDWRQTAADVEAQHPELEGRLLTAVQQETRSATDLNYLQERLVDEVVAHHARSKWSEVVPQTRVNIAQFAHLLALVLFGVVVLGLRSTGGHALLARNAGAGITVTPGDTSLERGNSLVVLARFEGALPVTVDLVVGSSSESSHRITLVKSLADPLFGGSVPEVSSNLVYHIEYGGKRTRDYNVKVFEYPRLERADADLVFPEYTGQANKHIKDTRRLSAVEGSHLDLSLQLNKSVASARLVGKDDSTNVISLTVLTNRAAVELKQFPFATSRSYELQLVDADNRTNKVPAQFVFEVLKNRAPELKLASPRGDVRPSALEEIAFEGTVWDDFGTQTYGLAYALVGQEPKFIELGRAVPAKEKRPFKHVLRLEDLGLQSDQLISWFVWADDIGPDGQLRRTAGDLFFAEVRPFDEIFREGQPSEGQGPPGQPGNQSSRLAELQKQIINATWKLQREHKPSNSPAERKVPTERAPDKRNPPTSNFRNGTDPHRLASQVSFPGLRIVRPQFMGQPLPAETSDSSSSKVKRAAPRTASPGTGSQYLSDAGVVLDSQAQALEEAQGMLERQSDPRATALWRNAIQEMQKAQARLSASTNSPAALADALAAEQAAYQALLKLQEHEFQVTRQGRNQRGGGGGREQQMQLQLEQMDLAQSDNRYETQTKAQSSADTGRREQLQVMNRLQELARRQQDLNDRLQEFQTALQEARSEQEREEIKRRLKRLQEEEQQMLADVDEVRQRMDRPENQSRMAEERKQLEQTRNDVQRAAEAAAQGSPSQALASGTRAQRQLQEMRDQMRKENSSQFAEDLRQLRAEARQLARQQEDISKQMQPQPGGQRKSLSDSDDHKEVIDQLARQSQRLTNLVDRATQVSEQAESSEPLLSRQLYDTVREFSQDSSKNLKAVQDELLSRGMISQRTYEQLKANSQSDSAKLLDLTSELLRENILPQASATEQRVRSSVNDLQRGVERAAQSILGDDTEALQLAQQQLDQLTDQLQREIAAANGDNSGTNQAASQAARTGNKANADPSATRNGKQNPSQPGESSGDASAQAGEQNQSDSDQANAKDGSPSQGAQARSSSPSPSSSQRAQRGASRTGNNNSARAGGGGGYGGGNLDFDRILNPDATPLTGPIITGENFAPWSDRLRDVEEMIDAPDLRNDVAAARERARLLRLEFKRDLKKPDWTVVRLQVIKPLVEVRDRIAEELARRQSNDSLVPIDRDPVPDRYSELVRRYYEKLGKER